jgi:hypothetical protein
MGVKLSSQYVITITRLEVQQQGLNLLFDLQVILVYVRAISRPPILQISPRLGSLPFSHFGT